MWRIIADLPNRIQISAIHLRRSVTRSLMSEKKSFIRYGIEAIEYKRLKSLVREGKHPIATQNILKHGQNKLIEHYIEKKTNTYLKHTSTEEALDSILQAIKHDKIDLDRLPNTALRYYKKKHRKQPLQTNPAPVQHTVAPPEIEKKRTPSVRKMSPQQQAKLKQAQEKMQQKQKQKRRHKP